MSTRTSPLVGVLAGGRGRRMGGRDKAWLRLPSGEALIERWLRLCAEVQLEVVMVGGNPPSGTVLISDQPAGIGPAGGLCALLDHAGARPVIAVACDMPYVTAALLRRLTDHPSTAPVLAPRDPTTDKWQPLFARYTSAALPSLLAAIGSGRYSLQPLLAAIAAEELPLREEERLALRDWDEPADMLR